MPKWPKKGTDEFRAFMRNYMKEYSERKKQDPEYVERYRQYHREYARQWSSDPEHRQRVRDRQNAAWRERRKDPAFVEKERARAKEKYRKRKALADAQGITLRDVRKQVYRARGITEERYQEMLSYQNGVCAICKGMQRDGRKHLAIDHDHATGKVRGLLCDNCNVGLGSFKDDPARIYAAIAYLEAHSTI